MKALVLREHGGNDKLSYETDFPDPVPGEGDVVIRVRACSLNYHDIFTRRGMPGIKIAMPAIMGLDVAGEIASIGPGVTGWSIGERVLADPINRVEGGLIGETVHGGLAELCRVRAHQLIRDPRRRLLPRRGRVALRLRHCDPDDVHQRARHRRREGADPGRQRRCRNLLPAAREDRRRRGDRLRRNGREGGAAQGARGRSHDQLRNPGFRQRNLRALRQAGPARRRHRSRGRCRRELYRRRNLGEIAPRSSRGRSPSNLRRHRRLRSQGGSSASSGPSN